MDDETKLLTVAKCYGFRNIQNQVQRLKRSKCDYDYVEIMACPSGCINGGGQIRGASVEERKQILDAIELPCSNDNSEMEEDGEKCCRQNKYELVNYLEICHMCKRTSDHKMIRGRKGEYTSSTI
ncbi:Cytosolic Fe-S cluster assembly factor NARFL [Dirofilaria immitis]|nr:Cytosolic Fe-S cluster assembly factor NARFL [Dirofilaria immitis]